MATARVKAGLALCWGSAVELALVMKARVSRPEGMAPGELALPLVAAALAKLAGQCWRAPPGGVGAGELAG